MAKAARGGGGGGGGRGGRANRPAAGRRRSIGARLFGRFRGGRR